MYCCPRPGDPVFVICMTRPHWHPCPLYLLYFTSPPPAHQPPVHWSSLFPTSAPVFTCFRFPNHPPFCFYDFLCISMFSHMCSYDPPLLYFFLSEFSSIGMTTSWSDPHSALSWSTLLGWYFMYRFPTLLPQCNVQCMTLFPPVSYPPTPPPPSHLSQAHPALVCRKAAAGQSPVHALLDHPLRARTPSALSTFYLRWCMHSAGIGLLPVPHARLSVAFMTGARQVAGEAHTPRSRFSLVPFSPT